uniref:Uncharacterized protein n=1 Tax=Noctiluca scintillans TaxID=2966 RepID=A0A7S1EW40_NOCSC|mmetsp:Transcript_12630/g.34950  ORF Transcript_12630/g.34950 Transcript_12630/m.34950 type:complete len:323 (+) Transcript_12630:25-993(+)
MDCEVGDVASLLVYEVVVQHGGLRSIAHQHSSRTVLVVSVPIILVALITLIAICMFCRPKTKDPDLSRQPLRSSASSTGWRESSKSLTNAAEPVHSPPTCLCSELVVPLRGECVLVLPSLRNVLSDDMVLRDIVDRNGKPLLRLALTRVPTGSRRSTQSELLMLAKLNEQDLTWCELEVPRLEKGRAHCSIFCASGVLFASLREEDGETQDESHRSFVVSGASRDDPWRLRINGDFASRKLSVTNLSTGKPVAVVTSGQDMAFTRSTEDYYKVRLGPLGDSALVIMSCVVIDRILTLTNSPGSVTSSNVPSSSLLDTIGDNL